ncbi:MAG: maleylpyruvate isomerase N-terminal domain-containing protein [Acidimicrobiales bacterium]
MTLSALAALRTEREAVLGVIRTLTPEEWAARSDAEGWTVLDVIAHLSWTQRSLLGIESVKALWSRDIEALNEDAVRPRRRLGPEGMAAEYETWSRRAIRAQRVLNAPPVRRLPLRLGELGVYPVHLLSNGFVFDHWTHLRCDVLAPLGPVERARPASDAATMAPLLEWMFAGLPRMVGAGLSWMREPVALRLVGPAGGTWHLGPANARGRVLVSRGGARPAATVTSPVEEFPVWGTRRRPWRDRDVKVEGDADLAARFLDAVRIV